MTPVNYSSLYRIRTGICQKEVNMKTQNDPICIISFSSRANGSCGQIGSLIQEYYGQNACLFRFSDFSISSCNRCNYQCFSKNRPCPHLEDMEQTLIKSILSSALTYFIVPNYCDFPCSNYFVFCERQQSYFGNHTEQLKLYEAIPKRFITITNTNQDNFKRAFSYHVNGTPDILYLSARHYGKISLNGDLLSSSQAKKDILSFLSSSSSAILL